MQTAVTPSIRSQNQSLHTQAWQHSRHLSPMLEACTAMAGCIAMLCWAVLCQAMLCYIVPCYAVLHQAVLRYAVLHCAVLRYIVLGLTHAALPACHALPSMACLTSRSR